MWGVPCTFHDIPSRYCTHVARVEYVRKRRLTSSLFTWYLLRRYRSHEHLVFDFWVDDNRSNILLSICSRDFRISYLENNDNNEFNTFHIVLIVSSKLQPKSAQITTRARSQMVDGSKYTGSANNNMLNVSM